MGIFDKFKKKNEVVEQKENQITRKNYKVLYLQEHVVHWEYYYFIYLYFLIKIFRFLKEYL